MREVAGGIAGEQYLIKEPVSRPGDYIELRAEMDLIIAFSNCPMDVVIPVNGWACTPLKIEIYEV